MDTFEIRMLGWAIALGFVYLLLAAALGTAQRGLAWNAGNRDGALKPLTGPAARADRAWRNFMETFPFFAAAVLAAVASDRIGAETALGVQLYVWARLVYLPVYVIGIPYLRTAVWAVSIWGVFKIVMALF